MSTNPCKILPIVALVFVLFFSACLGPTGGNQTGNETGNQTGARFLQISATSPHVADAVDSSSVAVLAFDVDGKPVSGSKIKLILSGEAFYRIFGAREVGNGMYVGYVAFPYSGVYSLRAIDEETDAQNATTIEFTPGRPAELRMAVSNPRLSPTGDAADVEAWVIDGHGNIVPDADVSLTTDFGYLSEPLKGPDGKFRASLISYDIGTANVTAHYSHYDERSEGHYLTQRAEVDFPLLFIDVGSFAIYGDSYPAALYLYVPGKSEIGYYSFEMRFNPQVLAVEDGKIDYGDQTMETAPSIGSDYIYFTKYFREDARPANQIIKVATVNFAVVGTGPVGIDVTFYDLSDSQERPLVSHFRSDQIIAGTKATTPVGVVKENKPICIKVWNVNGSVTENGSIEDFEQMKVMFGGLVRKSCPRFDFTLRLNNLSSDDWANASGGDGDMDIDVWDDIDRLFAHREADCINIYYIPNFSNVNVTGITLSPFDNPPERSGIMLGKGKANNRTMGHEVGHYLGLSHDEYEINASGNVSEKLNPATNESVKWTNESNLMYEYRNQIKFDLTGLQCEWVAKKNP